MREKLNCNSNKFIEKQMMYIVPLIFIIMNIILILLSKQSNLLDIEKYYKIINKIINIKIIKEGAIGIAGFTITIVSIFGVGISSSTIKIAKNNKINVFFKYIKSTFVTAIILYILTNFNLTNTNIIIQLSYICYVLITFLIALRFIVIVFIMFKDNLDNIEEELSVKSLEEKDNLDYKKELLFYTKGIYDSVNSKNVKAKLTQKKKELAKEDKKYNKSK